MAVHTALQSERLQSVVWEISQTLVIYSIAASQYIKIALVILWPIQVVSNGNLNTYICSTTSGCELMQTSWSWQLIGRGREGTMWMLRSGQWWASREACRGWKFPCLPQIPPYWRRVKSGITWKLPTPACLHMTGQVRLGQDHQPRLWGLGNFNVNLRFHPTSVGRSLGSTRTCLELTQEFFVLIPDFTLLM